jgi:hypothetical protein
MSTRNLPAREADNLTAIFWADCIENVGASTACYSDSFTSKHGGVTGSNFLQSKPISIQEGKEDILVFSTSA